MMLKMAIMYWMGHPMTNDEYHAILNEIERIYS